ncbi:BLUF domain-containing protein [Azospirillum sp. 412522]|nr:BLUF domain-containing protein [Azospirillum sp. 412522]MBY6263701.1 BLUF domain-containing protein [Azospirillum sp. 412522]
MLQIVFRSQLTRLLSYIDIQRLCLAAAKNNRKAGITGFAVECGGAFLVSIEGDPRAVRDMFNRMVQDPRHDTVQMVCCEEGLGRRRFGAWAMNVMFMDDDLFWHRVLGSSFSCDQMLSPRTMEPAFALGLLAMAYQYACAEAETAPSLPGGRPGRIPRIRHMFRR